MENKAENIENHSEDLCPQDLSRRNFLKFGMNSFLGMIALKHLQLPVFAQTDHIVASAEHCIVLL